MATILKGTKANTFYNSYFRVVHRYGYRNVRDVYRTPSGSKLYAESRIFDDMKRIDNSIENAYTLGYTVIGYNCSTFSAAYKIMDTADSNKGIAVIYYTAYNTYIIPLEKFSEYADEITKAVRA
jgi:hypothetical protein